MRRSMMRKPALSGVLAGMAILALLAGCADATPTRNSSPGPAGSPHESSTRATATGGPSGHRTSHQPSASGRTSPGQEQPATSSSIRSHSFGPTASTGGSAASCSQLARHLTRDQRIGQLFMSGVDSSGIGTDEATTLSRLNVGSVVLLGNSTGGVRSTKKVSNKIKKALRARSQVSPLVAVDQEGGDVQRLSGPGFDRIPSAVRQARLSDAELTRRATRWGRQLGKAGVDADLAPVADVVPASMRKANMPIGALHRGYGADASVVADKNAAFIKGMRSAHQVTGVKHFPGLGKVHGNTDVDPDVVDRRTTRTDHDLRAFRAGVRAGTDMVMLSSARYAKIDPHTPATFSKKIISGMVRDDVGFDGVVISDDLQGKALHQTPVQDRALKFIRAGGDLAIVGNPSQVPSMIKTVRAAAADDHELQAAIRKSASRVLAMKAEYGLARCG